jgi:hypothetical protein
LWFALGVAVLEPLRVFGGLADLPIDDQRAFLAFAYMSAQFEVTAIGV